MAPEVVCDESKILLQSLPKKDLVLFGKALYQYQKFWFLPEHLEALMSIQQHFEACDSDIFLVTQPKAGTIWLKALVFTIVNRSRYLLASHPLLTANPHSLVPFLELQLYVNNQVPDLSELNPPRVFGSHMPCALWPESFQDTDCRIIYLCRNPKDTFVSWWHFMNKLWGGGTSTTTVSLEDAFDLFCNGVCQFGPYWEHVLEYWKLSLEKPGKVFFFKYEDLKEDTETHLKKLADFVGYPFSLEEEEDGIVDKISRLCSFENLSSLDVNKTGKILPGLAATNNVFFRSGHVGDWKDHLTQEMVERMDSIIQEKLAGSGLML